MPRICFIVRETVLFGAADVPISGVKSHQINDGLKWSAGCISQEATLHGFGANVAMNMDYECLLTAGTA